MRSFHPHTGSNSLRQKKIESFEEKILKWSLSVERNINSLPGACTTSGCMRLPRFGYLSSGKKEKCSFHKIRGMIDLNVKRCSYPGCNKTAVCGYPLPQSSERKRRIRERCASHKEEGMINFYNQKRCTHPGCRKFPVFGFLEKDGKRLRCLTHKEEGMVNGTN